MNSVEFLGAIIGLAYIFLEYRASWWLWIVGMAMSLFYIYIFAKVSCYAWALTYLYYFGANVYGIILWGKKSKIKSDYGISNLPKKNYRLLGIAISCLFLFIFIIIYKFTDSKIPISESFSTALGVVGTWLLAKKYLQHWVIWMVVNAIYAIAGLYLGLYFSAILFVIYFVVSVMGFIRWQKLAGKIEK